MRWRRTVCLVAVALLGLTVVVGCGSESSDDGDRAGGADGPASDDPTAGAENAPADDGGGGGGDGGGEPTGAEYQSDAAFTFVVPDGWSVARASGFSDDDYNFYVARDTNQAVLDTLIATYGPEGAPGPVLFGDRSPEFDEALADEAARELAYVYVSVDGPPLKDLGTGELWPWDTTDDIAAYIADQWPNDEVTAVQVGSHTGYRRQRPGERTVIYELLAEPGVRVFAINQIGQSTHSNEIEAIIASLRPTN